MHSSLKVFKHFFILFFKGIFVGAVDVLPGISGGTIALALGIYHELIYTINRLSLNSLGLLFKGRFSKFWVHINCNFLIPFVLGVLVGIFTLARTIEWLFSHYTVFLWSFFMGLLIISIYYLLRDIKLKRKVLIQLIIAAAFSFGISCLGSVDGNTHYLYIFFCGSVGIIAMILPGISGALILIILGVYPTLIEQVNRFSLYFLQFNNPEFIGSIITLSIFVAGVLVGIKTFARLLDYLFRRYASSCYAILVGIMIGVLYRIWPWQNDSSMSGNNTISQLVWPGQYQDDPNLIAAILLFLFGIIIMVILEKLGFISSKQSYGQQ